MAASDIDDKSLADTNLTRDPKGVFLTERKKRPDEMQAFKNQFEEIEVPGDFATTHDDGSGEDGKRTPGAGKVRKLPPVATVKESPDGGANPDDPFESASEAVLLSPL